jgi:hypothetical protein
MNNHGDCQDWFEAVPVLLDGLLGRVQAFVEPDLSALADGDLWGRLPQ